MVNYWSWNHLGENVFGRFTEDWRGVLITEKKVFVRNKQGQELYKVFPKADEAVLSFCLKA